MVSTLNYSTRYTLHYIINSYVILDNIYLLNSTSTKYILRFNLKRQNAIPPKILDKQEKHLFVRAKKYIYIYIYITH